MNYLHGIPNGLRVVLEDLELFKYYRKVRHYMFAYLEGIPGGRLGKTS